MAKFPVIHRQNFVLFYIFIDIMLYLGLDMAHQYNGYVYHTRFDRPEIIPRGSFQNTGDNVLALVKEIANAPELEDSAVRIK